MKTSLSLSLLATAVFCVACSNSDAVEKYKTQNEAMAAARQAALVDLKQPAEKVSAYFVCQDSRTRIVLVAKAGDAKGRAAVQAVENGWTVTPRVEEGSYATFMCGEFSRADFEKKLGVQK
jgi:hypothetical protein